MSLSTNFPNTWPTLLLDFANAKRLDPRITFTRASPAVYYDGTTTAVAEQNLILYSQEFQQTSVWTQSGVTVSANSSTAPDGTTTADKIIPTAVSGTFKELQQNFTIIAGLTYAFSVFLKADGYNFVQLLGTAANWGTFAINYDLSTGLETQFSAGSSTVISRAITSVGSGWYRVSVVVTATGSGSGRFGFNVIPASTSARGVTWTGDGTSGVLAWGFQVEQRNAVTAYTVTTTAAITNYVPVLLTAAANVARFTANPVTGLSLGLLIEEVRTNLILQSEDFATTWFNFDSSEQTNVVVAPNGTITGDKIVDNTNNAVHAVAQSLTILANTNYTFSCYVKAAEYTTVVLRIADANTPFTSNNALFNLSAVTAVTDSSGFATTNTPTITAVGNGWYRCTMGGVLNASSTSISVQIRPRQTSAYIGDGYSGVYVWGAQLEEGAFATSYIATVASPQTRQADNAVMTGTNFSSWYNAGEGTIYGSYIGATQLSGATRRLVEIGNNTIDDRFVVGYSAASISRFLTVSGGSITADVTVGGINPGTGVKMIATYKTNDFQQASNGTLGTADTSGTVPPVLQMNIGSDYANAANTMLNGTVAKIAYYDTRLTNAQLQALTLT